MTVIVWFRRDLRLGDSPTLTEAELRGGHVLPLFVEDPRLLARAGRRRQDRLWASLAHLDEGIRSAGGTGLLVASGDPREVVPSVAREHRARDVLVTADFAPYGRTRDAAVSESLRSDGRRLVVVDSPYLHEPGTVHKADGSGFSVFTAFFRSWQAAPSAPPLQQARVRFAAVSGRSLPPDAGRQPAGEELAQQLLHRFVGHALPRYGADRNRTDLGATSGLSAALHFGEIHPRSIVSQACEAVDPEPYLRQLAWRDFYADVLYRKPELARASLDPRFDAFGWRTDRRALRDFEAWCHGRTGYPFVDAGMRQLLQTGWMHNRARMVTASFLTKDLRIPWQWGARWFARHLLDGDVANNNLGWQWVAGTGLDPAPFHRVFNPVTQGRRFDPEGAYVHRYVPELRAVPGGDVHEPQQHPPAGYVRPMVDHARARREALDAYAAIQSSRP